MVDEIGRWLLRWVDCRSVFGLCSTSEAAVSAERATVFVIRFVGAVSALGTLVGVDWGLGFGRPDMKGGGSSSPSVAFFDNCRAKSDACHHSRNLSANMEVGRRIFRLESSRG